VWRGRSRDLPVSILIRSGIAWALNPEWIGHCRAAVERLVQLANAFSTRPAVNRLPNAKPISRAICLSFIGYSPFFMRVAPVDRPGLLFQRGVRLPGARASRTASALRVDTTSSMRSAKRTYENLFRSERVA
jgi:hypothetical protein